MTEISQKLSTARAQYQVCRLSLFQARLLADIERSRECSAEVAALVADAERNSGYDSSVPLVNQATYLQMAYMTLVFPREGVIGAVCKGWEPELSWDAVKIIEDTRPRFSKEKNWKGLLQTVRNSLSHSSVEVQEEDFVFTDEYTDRGRVTHTVRVGLSWPFLGALTEEFFKAANRKLYE